MLCLLLELSYLAHAGVARAADANKKGLGIASACLLACVPWMQISRAAASDVHVSLASLAAVTAAGVAVHAAYLLVNSAAVRLLRIGGPPGPACAPPVTPLIIPRPFKSLQTFRR